MAHEPHGLQRRGQTVPPAYLIVDGQVVDRLPGQRSAKDLLDWIARDRAGV